MASYALEQMKEEEGRSSSEETGYGSDLCQPDDSDEDPTFDIVEKTRLSLSKISLKKSKPRSRSKGDGTKGEQEEEEEEEEEVEEAQEVQIPELDAKDRKCFEVVEKLIKETLMMLEKNAPRRCIRHFVMDGLLDKLKVDQCKVYLRKYGLRLTGKKDTLLARIKEHLDVKDGGGEKIYPVSSFVNKCKGDACTGDVVMFEQKVYENFNIASRSAAPLGTRIVAGRIVKESYGKTKQQHTFTVEVLWSKGAKPWPPLHPFLIKGRNLYGPNTMRQDWKDEEQRKKVIEEKHARGSVARHLRRDRLQLKEMRNKGRMKRMKENKSKEGQKHQKVCQFNSDSVQQENTRCQQQPKGNLVPVRSQVLKQHNFTDYVLETQVHGWNVFGKPFGTSIQKTLQPDIILSEQAYHQPSAVMKQADVADGFLKNRATAPAEVFNPHRLASISHHKVQLPQQTQNCFSVFSNILDRSGISHPNLVHPNNHRGRESQKNEFSTTGTCGFPAVHYDKYRPPPPRNSSGFQSNKSVLGRYFGENNFRCISPPPRRQPFACPPRMQYPAQQRQQCRHYRQGRCYFGEECKFLHDYCTE